MMIRLVPKTFFDHMHEGLDLFVNCLGFQVLHQDSSLAVVGKDGAKAYVVERDRGARSSSRCSTRPVCASCFASGPHHMHNKSVFASLLAAVLAACAPATTNGDSGAAATGRWGGEHVALELTPAGGVIEYDCAHGGLTQAVRLGSRGEFEAHRRPRSRAWRASPRGRAARFRPGAVRGARDG